MNKLGDALRHDGLGASSVRNSLKHARRFIRYLTARQVSPEQARPKDVDAFMQSALRVYHKTIDSPPSAEPK